MHGFFRIAFKYGHIDYIARREGNMTVFALLRLENMTNCART
jgi:hypothetical protein